VAGFACNQRAHTAARLGNAPKDLGVRGEHTASENCPNAWFAKRFPGVEAQHGHAVQIKQNHDGERAVCDISEDFIASTLSAEGSPGSPTVYLPEEGRFYTYDAAMGLYQEDNEPALAARLSKLLLLCSQESGGAVDVSSLAYRFRKTSSLNGVIRRARGVLATSSDFFESNLTEFIPCANGMLRLSDLKLLPFSPAFRRRNKLAIPYVPGSCCPQFLDTLMKPALSEDDLDLLQRWCGQTLIGRNLAQSIIFLTGTAGGGKGAFIRVLRGIIGPQNMATLRSALLMNRFELGRFLGRTLLYGADVPPDFLNCGSASVLKSLTGGDPVTLEFKGVNSRPEIVCQFNVIVTANGSLRIKLQGDIEAWRRRLRIIQYAKPPPRHIIPDLSDIILREEAPGVLNWMLAGLDKTRQAGWKLDQTPRQQGIVDDLLTECQAPFQFSRDCLRQDASGSLTSDQVYERFSDYCVARGWDTIPKARFTTLIEDAVRRELGISRRNDITGPNGKAQRGWKGIAWK